MEAWPWSGAIVIFVLVFLIEVNLCEIFSKLNQGYTRYNVGTNFLY